jgi:membrane-anchored protein YejM (alkaline phosphatase superfamily)
MSKINRRDFIKLAGISPIALSAPNFYKSFNQPSAKKNVIIVVFDAFSAYNMSLYGYSRQTTPNITKLAEHARVYHNHYASSNYTTSGTASLLTGTYPWTHRALKPNSTVVEDYKNRNIFTTFDTYYRIAYSHNPWVNTLFEHFQKSIDEFIPREQLTLFSFDKFIQNIFSNDADIASVSWARNVKAQQEDIASSTYSLVLSRLLSYFEERYTAEYISQFPRRLPTSGADNGFLLEHAIDWIVQRIQQADDPVFGYFHFFPPHDPYWTVSQRWLYYERQTC